MNPPLDRTPPAPPRDRARSQSAARARAATSSSRGVTPRSGERRDERDQRGERGQRGERDRQTVQVTSGTGTARRSDPQHRARQDHRSEVHVVPTAHAGQAGHGHHRVDRRPLLVAGVAATLVCGFFATRGDDGGDVIVPAAAAAAVADVAAAPTDASLPALSQAAAPVAGVVADPTAAAAADPAAATAAAVATADGEQGADGEDLTSVDTCLMDKLSVRLGETGQSVTCLQQALVAQGYYTGAVSGSFDQATFDAVEAMQTDRNLYVDGIVGRESALSLGI